MEHRGLLRFWGIVTAGTLVALLVVGLGLRPIGEHSAAAQEVPASTPPGITAIGQGSAEARPDQATIVVGVQATRPTAAEALAEANRGVEAVLTRLDGLGIPRSNVQTSGLSVVPIYQQPTPGTPAPNEQGTLTGYRATNQLSVLVTDLARTGQVLDEVVAAGANQVGGIRFGLRDASALRNQALQQAVQSARSQAEAMASGLGVRLGAIRSVRQESGAMPLAAPAAEVRAGTPVEPGQVAVTARVQVTFDLVTTP